MHGWLLTLRKEKQSQYGKMQQPTLAIIEEYYLMSLSHSVLQEMIFRLQKHRIVFRKVVLNC